MTMDIKTMLFALALGNLALCAALFFHLYERHKTPALGSWALARQLQAGGSCRTCSPSRPATRWYSPGWRRK